MRRPQDGEAALTEAIVGLAAEYGRYGDRRIPAMLRADGWRVNARRVQRIWRREGLKVPKKQPKRGASGGTTGLASDYGRAGQGMSGLMTSSRTAPRAGGPSAC